jgi:hypothetical protein
VVLDTTCACGSGDGCRPQVGADLVGDRAEGGEVELARVGGPAGDDDLGAVLTGERAHLLHVDQAGVVDVVRDHVVQTPGEVDLHAVRQVPAVGEVQTHDGVVLARDGVQDRGVGAGTRVRLDVRVLGAEQLLQPVDRDLLDLVDDLAPAVVALARVALGVLVGEDAALRLQRGDRREVLRRDHLERRLLTGELGVEETRDVGVERGERLVVVHGYQGSRPSRPRVLSG